MAPVSAKERRLRHILLSLDGRWLLDWTPRAASHGIVWTFLEANGLLESADSEFPDGETRLHEYRFHRFYARHGYCSEDDLLHAGRLRFKVVRDPYKRIVTSFLQLHANRHDFEAHSNVSTDDCTFIGFLEWLRDGNLDRNVHWMPQRQSFENDLSFWNFVIRAEDLDAGLDEINDRWALGLKPPPSRHLHSSGRRGSNSSSSNLANAPLRTVLADYPGDYARFFDKATFPLIESLVGDDARFYGYECPYPCE